MTPPAKLDRNAPTSWEHVEKYPMLAGAITKPTPVILGINWYSAFDEPVFEDDGRWWIPDGNLGSIRGGHCICVKSKQPDLMAWYRFYDQGSEGACFERGTLVRMADGTHMPIEDIKPLDIVVSAEGRPQRVLGTMARFHDAGMIRLALRGHRHLRCTPEHPILTARGYVPARDLKLGDEVCLTRYLPAPIETIEVTDHIEERALRERTAVRRTGGVASMVSAPPRTIALTADFGRLIGLFLAEGNTTPHKVQWTFGSHERDTLAAETVELIASTLGAEARLQIRPNGVVNVVLYGKSWRFLFERLFVISAYDKRLGIADGPPEFLRAVLDGWLAGDGYERRSTRQGITVSRRLAHDMYAIAQGLGLRPTIRRSTPEGRRERWDVEVATGGRSTHSRQDDSAVWRKVVGLEFEEYAGFVHNLHVENDESYVADGIGVHNCVGFGISRAQTMLNRVEYDAMWLYHEAQKVDEWPGEDYDGTSVNAGLKVAREQGLKRQQSGVVAPSDGISAYRWATSVDEVHQTIRLPIADSLGAVPLLNSWGTYYPHLVWMPDSVLERLLREDGEAAVISDR